ncbi:non-processive endocellulase [Roseateles sp. YR242]|uniref:glycoside hydrolase family 9 protein n=1 Tax=Roseateles sp. YR242 TaxID=1855305 RepID=UPI0008BC30D6|nr:glycoside hydrolase family 9 protein [Roseateles sp. YR242]SEL37234.1 non-processive endocellulase [Roseateles sp. YR242]
MWAGSLNRSDVRAVPRRWHAFGVAAAACSPWRRWPLLLLLPACVPAQTTVDQIDLNSVGFPTAAAKWAVVPNVAASGFTVVDARGRIVMKGSLSAPATWPLADTTVKLADLSALRKPGTYRVQVSVQGRGAAARSSSPLTSAPFVVGDTVYTPLTAAAIRAFYFNRAGIEVTPQLGGAYARAAGHPDTRILIHASATGPQRKEGDVISSPKGWYDAGDYNKYIVNSGISTYTLLAAYEHFPAFYRGLAVGLPESGNGLPDLLNEALWNLDWMLTMQDPADGGVYHKLTNLRFDGMVMPAQATAERYVVQKTTAATLDFAAVMATASRVLAPFEAQSPGRSQRMRAAALAAWDWARQHKDVIYRQPADVVTGGYDDTKLDDEFAWAAAELFITTGEQRFLDAMRLGQLAINVPSWSDVGGLAWVSLAKHQDRLNEADRAIVQQRIRSQADTLVLRWKQSAWRVPMQAEDFRWGSNAEVLNQALMLIQAARQTASTPQARRDALAAAQANLDYVLGRNPLGRSQVTGFGLRPPMHPHHRPSEADGIQDPVPGFLVGGANPGQQDKAECPVPYPSTLTALSWLDHLCSYASNEVAINWNAPLVYVTGALQALSADNSVGARAGKKGTR